MKQLTIKFKILCAIIAIMIIAGITIVVLKGFEIDLYNKNSQMIQLNIGKEFDINDIKQMTDEIFNTEVILQKVEVYGEIVAITASEITDEQKSSMVDKINEKYETELKAEDITIVDIPHTELFDIIKPYIVPIAVSTAIILAYTGIRFMKLGMVKAMIIPGLKFLLVAIVQTAFMAIARIQMGSGAIILSLLIYIETVILITTRLENDLKKEKLENQE